MNRSRNDNRKPPRSKGGGPHKDNRKKPHPRPPQHRQRDNSALLKEVEAVLAEPAVLDQTTELPPEQVIRPDTEQMSGNSLFSTAGDYLSPEQSSRKQQTVAADVAATLPSVEKSEESAERVRSLAETPFVEEMTEKVRRYMRDELLMHDGETIVCAVSGGVDSIVLLDIMERLRKRAGYVLHVAHLNHKIRGLASDRDEFFVREVASFYEIPHHSVRKDVLQYAKDNKISVEVAARESRYRYLAHVTKTAEATALATAHTLNDSVETFLVNLMRGSGLTGLSGIPPFRPFTKQARLVRPLLCCKKEDVLRYAKERGLTWCEDETNGLPLYTRNKIRLDLLPKLMEDYNPSIVDTIQRTIQLIHGADKTVGLLSEKSLSDVVEEFSPTKVVLRISSLKLLSEFMQGEVIQKAIQRYMYLPPISLAAMDRILSLMDAETGTKASVSKRLIALRDREHLLLAENMPVFHVQERVKKNSSHKFGNWRIALQEVPVENVRYSRDTGVEYFDSDLLPSVLTVRTWQHGDSFKPLGMDGKMNISDYLTNSKVSTFDKAKVLVLATSQDIIWVCDKRASNDYKITDSTTTALRVEFRYHTN